MVDPAAAQAGKVEASDPKFDELESPNLGGNTGSKRWKPKKWLESEVKFKIKMPKSYTQQYVDSVTVKWYVAIKNPDSKSRQKILLLEKSIDYVNVPVDEDVYSSVYLSPAAIQRISGSDRASDSIIEAIGGEISVNGTADPRNKKRYFSHGKKVGWWSSSKLSRYDAIALLDKNETPFKFLWWDRYPEIKSDKK